MAWVFNHAPPDLDTGEMLVSLVLAEHANPEGGLAYPSVPRIAKMAHMSERGVQYALRKLVARGVVEVQYEATNKRPTVYRFPAFTGATSSPQPESRGATGDGLGVQSAAPRGATVAPKPSIEPLLEPSVPPLVPPRGKPKTEKESEMRDGRAKRLPTGWEPSTALVSWATEDPSGPGWNMFDVKRETEKFCDHFLANGKRMIDWDRAWKNWIRRARELTHNGKHDDAKAFAAWDVVLRALEYKREHGALPAERPDDDALHKAVAALGGWGALSGDRFDRAHFCQAYREFRQGGHHG